MTAGDSVRTRLVTQLTQRRQLIGRRLGGANRRRRPTLLVAAAVLLVVGLVVSAVLSAASTPSPIAGRGPVAMAPVAVPAAVDQPEGIAFSPDGRRAYVDNTGNGSVAVVDRGTLTQVGTILVPGGAAGLVMNPDGRHAYVTDASDDVHPGSSMSVLDLATGTVSATVPVGLNPGGTAVSPDGRRAFVTLNGTDENPGSTMVTVDTATNTVIDTSSVGLSPFQPTADDRRTFVPYFGDGTVDGAGVSVVPTADDIGAVHAAAGDRAGETTTKLAVGEADPVQVMPDGNGLVYVATLGPHGAGGGIQVVDIATGASHRLAGIPAGVEQLALSPDRRTLVAAVGGGLHHPAHVVTVMDVASGSVLANITLPGRPDSVSITPDGHEAWVTTDVRSGLWRIPLPPR